MTEHFRSQTPASIQAATHSVMLVELEKMSREVTIGGEAKSLTNLHELVKIFKDLRGSMKGVRRRAKVGSVYLVVLFF